MRPATRALLGAAGSWAVQRSLAARRPGGAERWRRTNHRGAEVSLSSGPALAVGAGWAAATQPAALLAGLGAGAVGAYDDLAGGPHAKGLRGHLTALRQGQVTSGSVKIGGLVLVGLTAARSSRGLDRLVGAAVVAGSANLLNLLDLRPGRALKAGLVGAAVLREPGVAAVCLAQLPGDLGERAMLGDTGANALGAVLGATYVGRGPSRRSALTVLGALVGLTALSEVRSYSALIDSTPPLRWFDALGRAR